jgi:hypothetical protein
VVPGCTDLATRERTIVQGPDVEHQIAVCWKHEAGELDINSLELGDWGE